jgi:peptidyl-prolyl cis-trans isomerase B (cyclophilin B)
MKKMFFLVCLFMLNVAFAANPVVLMETSHGEIEIELFEDKAPNTVANFLKYVDAKFYNGTIFHRVINGFMIQGGGFTQKMEEKKTREPIKNEATNGLRNDVGTLAMARTNDPHSATAQFFINVAENSSLNHTGQNANGWGYAVFGKVTQGMHVVNRIKMVKTGNISGYSDVPMDAVVIKSVKRKAKK